MAQPLRPTLLFLLTAGLVACPGVGRTPLSISDVVVTPDPPEGLELSLDVRGTGFGLGAVQYDLSEGTGAAQDPELRLRLFNRTGLSRVIDRAQLTVMSPQRLVAQVSLEVPLPPGVYFLAISGSGETADRTEPIFEVPSDSEDAGPGQDTGPRDGGFQRDADPTDFGFGPDGEIPDVPPIDTGTPDSGIDPDTGIEPDTGVPPDSGLGAFVGAYGYRRQVQIASTVQGPAGITIKVPVPHADLVTAGQALPNGNDLALYQGATLLAFQWDDRSQLGTNNLALIARLAVDTPPNGDPNNPLALYFGDPAATNAPSDGVFQLALRFVNGPGWAQTAQWEICDQDRSATFPNTVGGQGSFCCFDGNLARPPGVASGPRSTAGSPDIAGIRSPPPANTLYATSFFIAGQMVGGLADIFYWAYSDAPNNFAGAITPPAASYTGYAPNGTLTFVENNNTTPTREGWQLNPATTQDWQRAEVRFSPTIDQPSIHFRYISWDNNNSAGSGVAIDDFWIRWALEPDFGVTLGPVEPR